MNSIQNITGLLQKCNAFYKFHFISIFVLTMLFNYDTALSQKNDNAVLFFIAPGISSTLSSKNSDFDKKYFYAFKKSLNKYTDVSIKSLEKLSEPKFLAIFENKKRNADDVF